MYLVPECPLLHIRETELPVLVRVVDARQQATALLLGRDVQEELHDARAIAVQVALRRSSGGSVRAGRLAPLPLLA